MGLSDGVIAQILFNKDLIMRFNVYQNGKLINVSNINSFAGVGLGTVVRPSHYSHVKLEQGQVWYESVNGGRTFNRCDPGCLGDTSVRGYFPDLWPNKQFMLNGNIVQPVPVHCSLYNLYLDGNLVSVCGVSDHTMLNSNVTLLPSQYAKAYDMLQPGQVWYKSDDGINWSMCQRSSISVPFAMSGNIPDFWPDRQYMLDGVIIQPDERIPYSGLALA
jgi:hypothetical protein